MIELALLTFANVASIGPTNLLAIKEGIKHGAQNTFWILFGGVVIDLLYANLVGLGLAQVGENYFFKTVLLAIGVIVFISMGTSGLQAALKKQQLKPAKNKKNIHPFVTGMVMTLPNPFIVILWASAFTSLGIAYSPVLFFIFILGVGAFWAGVETIVVKFFRKIIKAALLRTIEIITSLIILGFAIKFAYQLAQLLLA